MDGGIYYSSPLMTARRPARAESLFVRLGQALEKTAEKPLRLEVVIRFLIKSLLALFRAERVGSPPEFRLQIPAGSIGLHPANRIDISSLILVNHCKTSMYAIIN
jgi:hypothetical protein